MNNTATVPSGMEAKEARLNEIRKLAISKRQVLDVDTLKEGLALGLNINAVTSHDNMYLSILAFQIARGNTAVVRHILSDSSIKIVRSQDIIGASVLFLKKNDKEGMRLVADKYPRLLKGILDSDYYKQNQHSKLPEQAKEFLKNFKKTLLPQVQQARV